jgi:hypothetical protein
VRCCVRPTIYGPGVHGHTSPGPRFLEAMAASVNMMELR